MGGQISQARDPLRDTRSHLQRISLPRGINGELPDKVRLCKMSSKGNRETSKFEDGANLSLHFDFLGFLRPRSGLRPNFFIMRIIFFLLMRSSIEILRCP